MKIDEAVSLSNISSTGGEVFMTSTRKANTTLMTGSLAGLGLHALALFGLPIPTAAGMAAFAAALGTAALVDVYRNFAFSSNYKRFAHLVEKRETIFRYAKRFNSAFRTRLIKASASQLRILDSDIKFYGKKVNAILDTKMKKTEPDNELGLRDFKERIQDAIGRNTTVTEADERLDEVAAPFVLTYRFVKKVMEDRATASHLKRLKKIANGDETKYTVDEMIDILMTDFVRDYRRGLIDDEEFGAALTALNKAVVSGDVSELVNQI